MVRPSNILRDFSGLLRTMSSQMEAEEFMAADINELTMRKMLLSETSQFALNRLSDYCSLSAMFISMYEFPVIKGIDIARNYLPNKE